MSRVIFPIRLVNKIVLEMMTIIQTIADDLMFEILRSEAEGERMKIIGIMMEYTTICNRNLMGNCLKNIQDFQIIHELIKAK